MFLAPSRFLLERYVDWGIPRDRIRFEDYGRMPRSTDVPERATRREARATASASSASSTTTRA